MNLCRKENGEHFCLAGSSMFNKPEFTECDYFQFGLGTTKCLCKHCDGGHNEWHARQCTNPEVHLNLRLEEM